MNEVAEINEVEQDSSEEKIDDDFSTELDENYQQYLRDGGKTSESELEDTDTEENDNISKDERNIDLEQNEKYNEDEVSVEKIKCRNEELAGAEHPDTGVPFEKKQVEIDGKSYEVVVPQFESTYDAQLPEDKYKATDREQFKECNSQLKEDVAKNKELKEQFDEEQLEQINDGETPDGYTWHHDAEAGKMQLVDTKTHRRTGHTGGRVIWGGGTDNR